MSRKFQKDVADRTAFIEVRTGEYFGEDDIERLADDYGRI
jgi:mannose-6-phosphate isomerase